MEYQAGGEQPSDSVGPVGASAPGDLGTQAGVIFLSGGGQSDLSQDNEPILYIGPNRTSAIDDIRSVVIYIFIITIFFTFFLILPGIRSDKFPTFLCITTSLVVTSIVLIALFGTTWHVGEAPISASYKAFSRDRIQGELSVRIGFHSVNISLIAHKYYILHTSADEQQVVAPQGATVLVSDNHQAPEEARGASNSGDDGNEVRRASATDEAAPTTGVASASASEATTTTTEASASRFEVEVDAEEEADEGEEFEESRVKAEAEAQSGPDKRPEAIRHQASSVDKEQDQDKSANDTTTASNSGPRVSLKRQRSADDDQVVSTIESHERRRQARKRSAFDAKPSPPDAGSVHSSEEYKIKRVNLDINYNERFYWIEPNQMRQEYRHALERGLPYPILTVVEYLSQDEAGFSWSRQYRAAGYYSSMVLWLAVCMCILMFCLHCAAPKYGVYAMQALGCLLLFTNLIYALLVPRGDQKLVIPFEGQSLSFRFGWNFWLVLIGGNYCKY